MGWIKLDDRFLDHPKFLEAGPLAGYLHIAAIAWSNQNRTDGLIPWAQAERLVNWHGASVTARMDEHIRDDDVRARPADGLGLAMRLVEVGLWEHTPNGDFAIHDYLEHQNSAAEIEALSGKRSVAGKKGANARWQNGKPDSNGVASASQADSKAMPEGRSKKEEVEKTASSPGPEVELCLLLADLIRQRDPKWKGPVASWHVHMRRLINDREGDTNEIERTMRWSQADSFWQTNILGAESFRKQYTKLLLKSSSPRPSSNPERDERRARGAAALRLLQSGESA
jgi:hypothetical protein